MAEQRILIFGGTFDPPHVAHVTLPPLVARRLDCRRIIYVPASINPLKSDDEVSPAEHRLAMLRLALDDVPDAEISTVELDRPGPSYTVDSLQGLREELGPGPRLRLLIGSDQALSFTQWKDWQRILELATPAVMVRPPLDQQTFARRLREVYAPPDADRWLTWTVPVPQVDICATELRKRLGRGEDARGLVPPRVADYIRAHGLYRSAAA